MNAALFPVPDLSRLSAEAAFGLGDADQAARVRAERQAARTVHEADLPPIWRGEELLPEGLRLLESRQVLDRAR
jgi:hypothetical protein